MTPKEKSQELLKAMRFCKEKNLFRPGELEAVKGNKEAQFKLACQAVIRMELYQKAHPEK